VGFGGAGQGTGLPEGLAAGQAEAGERARGGQGLQCGARQVGAAYEVFQVPVGAVFVALEGDAFGRLGAEVAHGGEAEADRGLRVLGGVRMRGLVGA
jgi:hypothetical protein